MPDTGPPLSLPLMAASSLAKETIYNDAVAAINTQLGAGNAMLLPPHSLKLTVTATPPAAATDTVHLTAVDTAGIASKGGLLVTTEDNTQHVFGNVIGLGITSNFAPNAMVHVKGPDGGTANFYFDRYSTNTGPAALYLRHARGTFALPTHLNASDDSGILTMSGYGRNAANTADGFTEIARIGASIESKDAEGRLGGRLQFSVSAGVSAPLGEAARLTSAGNWLLGVTTAGTGLTKGLALGPGTAPSTAGAGDTVQLWAADRGGVAGKRALHVMAEDLSMVVLGDFSGFGTTSPLFPVHVNGRLGFGVPNSGGQDANLANSQATMYLSAAEDQVIVRVKTSTGVLKSGVIALA